MFASQFGIHVVHEHEEMRTLLIFEMPNFRSTFSLGLFGEAFNQTDRCLMDAPLDITFRLPAVQHYMYVSVISAHDLLPFQICADDKL